MTLSLLVACYLLIGLTVAWAEDPPLSRYVKEALSPHDSPVFAAVMLVFLFVYVAAFWPYIVWQNVIGWCRAWCFSRLIIRVFEDEKRHE